MADITVQNLTKNDGVAVTYAAAANGDTVKGYAAAVRRKRKPGHQECDVESCCADGRRNYNRNKMREYRAALAMQEATKSLKKLRRILRAEIIRELGL